MYFRYGRLKDAENQTRFKTMLGERQGFVWTPAIGFRANILGTLGKVKNLGKLNEDLTFIIGDPMHFKAVSSFWNQYGLTHVSSSGFYFISTALALCDDVQVFGFWPFNISADGRTVYNHYYNKLDFTKTHNMSYEFKVLIAMHHYGLLRMHVGKCNDYEPYENERKTNLKANRDVAWVSTGRRLAHPKNQNEEKKKMEEKSKRKYLS